MFWCLWLLQSFEPLWKKLPWKQMTHGHRFRISNKKSFELNVTVGTFEKRLQSKAAKRTKDVPTIDLHALDPSKARHGKRWKERFHHLGMAWQKTKWSNTGELKWLIVPLLLRTVVLFPNSTWRCIEIPFSLEWNWWDICLIIFHCNRAGAQPEIRFKKTYGGFLDAIDNFMLWRNL